MSTMSNSTTENYASRKYNPLDRETLVVQSWSRYQSVHLQELSIVKMASIVT